MCLGPFSKLITSQKLRKIGKNYLGCRFNFDALNDPICLAGNRYMTSDE